MHLTHSIDLQRYFQRIGYQGSLEPVSATLAGIHLAHATSIAFENFDVLLGRGIKIDLESIERKLVTDRRGGYCFEQNLLLAQVLQQLGFSVTRLLARVRFGTSADLPRTHMLLKVDVDGTAYLADVGFGAWGLLSPLVLAPGVQSQSGWQYRLEWADDTWLLQAAINATWHNLYSFTLEPQLPVDFEPANWYVSTHPTSPFVKLIIAQRPTADVRYVLRNYDFIRYYPGRQEAETVDSMSLLKVLSEHFQVTLPPDTVLPQLAEYALAVDASNIN